MGFMFFKKKKSTFKFFKEIKKVIHEQKYKFF